MKILWFDTETTGTDSTKNDILTIACIVEIDGVEKDRIYLEMQPFNYETITEEALKINGLTLDKIKTFQKPQEAYKKLVTFLGKYCNKYNKLDKYQPAGHNVQFDIDFLKSFFLKNNDNYLFSYLDYHKIDTVQVAQLLKVAKFESYVNCKLETLAASMDYKEPLHNSMNDIIATKAYYYKIISRLRYVKED